MRRGSKADEIMTLAFMILAIATVVCYVMTFSSPDKRAFWYVGGVAVFVRLIQYILRFVK
ncbi:MAG TPA: hypothetical protein H9977_12020 [Candidatus Parabacteroides intestinipullorum]|jgi:Mg2+/Co2+ transporter CorB|uniref:Uncharacterized protein n=1 Tax=Candidatus Parabacteroides intestinipullorum TaxID=2838723 RepID=A0A9D1XD09_9BACT|nr:hypothetical protein [Candidatus Parabacteroides intestinipullorum]